MFSGDHQRSKLNLLYGLFIGLFAMNGVFLLSNPSHGIHEKIRQHHSLAQSSLQRVETQPNLPSGLNDCAHWIPEKERKVLFVELHRWKDYYGPSRYKTGEYYASATWDYALKQNGFRVDRVSTKEFYDRMEVQAIKQYHRIFVRDPKYHRFYNMTDVICRVRPMYFFGDWFYKKNDHNYRFQYPFSESQILSANPDSHNTFIGYFPHNLLSPVNGIQMADRGKVGLLYGKKPEYFEGYYDLISTLLLRGFELHTTCKDTPLKKCPIPSKVVRHEEVKPKEFAEMMQGFSFMLGFKQPEGSPSPLVGMSYGVAFLNPLRQSGGTHTQHRALSRIGFPYTYVIDLRNTTQVLQAAEWSSKYRFNSYVPPQYRVDSVVNRICGVIEEDSLCLKSQ